MANPEWGLKRTCLGCTARFYDMQRDPIVCPKCGAELDPLALVRPRRARAAAASKAKAAAAERAAEVETDDLDDVVVDDDDDAISSDPDVSEVLEKAKDDDSNIDS